MVSKREIFEKQRFLTIVVFYCKFSTKSLAGKISHNHWKLRVLPLAEKDDQKMSETVAERVIRVFSEFKKVPAEEIKLDTTFEELGFDSLDGLNLIFELEEEFNVSVPDDKVQSMKSVREVVEGMEELTKDRE